MLEKSALRYGGGENRRGVQYCDQEVSSVELSASEAAMYPVSRSHGGPKEGQGLGIGFGPGGRDGPGSELSRVIAVDSRPKGLKEVCDSVDGRMSGHDAFRSKCPVH